MTLFNANGMKTISSPKKYDFQNNTETVCVTVDDYGYPNAIYVSPNHSKMKEKYSNGGVVYLALTYSPENKYQTICDTFDALISAAKGKQENYSAAITAKQSQLDELVARQEELLNNKELAHRKLENLLGPALREGYWNPDSQYKDTQQSLSGDIIAGKIENDIVEFIYDTTLFDSETKPYYYDSAEDIATDNKKYYPYLDISSVY